MTPTKRFNTFKTEAAKHIAALSGLISAMPDKGDKCCDSQKVCLTIALSDLESYVNGTGTNDFKD